MTKALDTYNQCIAALHCNERWHTHERNHTAQNLIECALYEIIA